MIYVYVCLIHAELYSTERVTVRHMHRRGMISFKIQYYHKAYAARVVVSHKISKYHIYHIVQTIWMSQSGRTVFPPPMNTHHFVERTGGGVTLWRPLQQHPGHCTLSAALRIQLIPLMYTINTILPCSIHDTSISICSEQ